MDLLFRPWRRLSDAWSRYVTPAWSLLVPSFVWLFLFFIISSWHFSLIYTAPDISLESVKGRLGVLLLFYAGCSVLATMAAAALLAICRRRRLVKWLTLGILWAFFAFLVLVRAVDWGSIYFGGQHVDETFWYHAFYIEGVTFLLTFEAIMLALAAAVSALLFIPVLILLAWWTDRMRHADGPGPAPGGPGAGWGKIFAVNGIPLAVLLAAVALFFQPWSGSAGLDARERMAAELPEPKVIGSLLDSMLGSGRSEPVFLDDEFVGKLEKCGLRLNSLDGNYPLMKRSIYLDPGRKSADKPALARGTNIIIVFAESLSRVFLDEEVIGIKGLTPHIHDMMEKGLSFTGMYNADYPTLPGMVATLGSGLNKIEKVRGLGESPRFRVPMLNRFLFLSDVLKKHGYSAVHVQGGSGTFVGMRDTFLKRQSYDAFYCRESVELLAHARYRHNREHWGVRDEDVLSFGVRLMKEDRIKRPFLMTISTLDMHPPFDPLFRHPAAGDSPLLNCLYSADRAIGVLWDYFLNSPRAGDTLLVLVADHAMGPNAEFLELVKHRKRFDGIHCDFIPCVFYIPGERRWRGRKNATLCTNLDIGPTILDMINIDTPNPFMGLSIFSERPFYPLTLCEYYTPALRFIMDRASARERDYIAGVNWTHGDHRRFSDFLRDLALRRAVAPEPRKDGGTP